MRYTIEKHERYVVIEPLVSFLDGVAAAKLKNEFMLRSASGQRNIVLDLDKVEDMTEEGMRMGLLAHRLCQSEEGLFIIIGLKPQVEHLLKVAKLDKYFTIVKRLKDAEDLIFSNEIQHDLIGK
ncbi:STAS domain-containing protein [Sphingobacterium rhinopitheci]|uniref:STAS domain-containing protein n=1 Tax=Sphingobacterium rhinopitheci TaxID=2781960 RepID=UPI001F527CF8|nr:STAS domain-containing protein [Sphingobacterium rhinopitheci]MCI0920824.1 STAS domain-containing protein [Sphingobacterium rhinopitheci]